MRRSQIREGETPEPEDDLLDLETERAFANAVIVAGMKRDPKRALEVIAHVAYTFSESGRYSVEEVSAAIDELLGELEAHASTSTDQPRKPPRSP